MEPAEPRKAIAMDVLQQEASKLQKAANLQDSIDDVDKVIEQLERAREAILAGMDISYCIFSEPQSQENYTKTLELLAEPILL